jgi:hypothetical protein
MSKDLIALFNFPVVEATFINLTYLISSCNHFSLTMFSIIGVNIIYQMLLLLFIHFNINYTTN